MLKDKKRSSSKKHEATKRSNPNDSENDDREDECAVCLDRLEIPVKLPCKHLFCFPCVKGVIMRNPTTTCPTCRRRIPPELATQPENFATEILRQPVIGYNYTWLYKNLSGWWAYAPRNQAEIETAFKSKKPRIECLIEWQRCVIDFKKHIQTLEKDPLGEYQPIVRDSSGRFHLGVAGMRYFNPAAVPLDLSIKN